MSVDRRRTLPGRYGTEIVFLDQGPIGGSNMLGGTTPLTANTTTVFRLGGFERKMRFMRFSALCSTKPADADGTVLARVVKIASDGSTSSTMSADIDLEAVTNDVPTHADRSTSASEADITVQVGESIRVNVVNNSAAIDTQPVNLIFVAEFALLE